MTTKERILAIGDNLTDEQLEELYVLLQRYGVNRRKTTTTFLEQLSQIQIDGPDDFAANLDQYHNQPHNY